MYKKMHKSIEQKEVSLVGIRFPTFSLLPIIGRFVNLARIFIYTYFHNLKKQSKTTE